MSQEKNVRPLSGWGMLLLEIILLILIIAGIWVGILASSHGDYALNHPAIAAFYNEHTFWAVLSVIALIIAFVLIINGFMVLQPGMAAVMLLFGRYVGSVKESGFYWVNPFYTRRRISLRMQNLNGDRLKVNDKAGNPIEIAMVMVWRVEDTYAASFEVENYQAYVKIQSESALRHMSSTYPYDAWEGVDDEITLRGNVDEVSKSLEGELKERLHKAGVVVVEARLSHLAYAPEIAEAMLRRQQATAIVAARFKIVEGAVGMVRLALEHLSNEGIVTLDEEKKATMVSNLLVVLCGEHAAQPVVNTGTLYQ